MLLSPLLALYQVPSSRLDSIRVELESLSEKPGLQQLAGHAQEDEVYLLLEGIQEAINSYKVCQQPLNPCQC